MSRLVRFFIFCACGWLLAEFDAAPLLSQLQPAPPPPDVAADPYPRLPGDFEAQRAVAISLSELLPQHGRVLEQIAEKTAGHVQLLVLYNEPKQVVEAVRLLSQNGKAHQHVWFYPLKLDTIWLRDFGPPFAELKSGALSIDFYYDGQRPLDDKLPIRWAQLTKAKLSKVPWTMHGGNLLSNGRGLAITSNRIFDDNYIRFLNPSPGLNPEVERRKMVVDAFKKYCNLKRLVVLEPLANEPTRHVDMFSVFLAPDLLVVAQLDPRHDPINAPILERNARKLKSLTVNGSLMRVERIQIPAPRGKSWSAYTNVIIANKLILIPTFRSDNSAIVERAVATYRRLLPDYAIETVDTTTMGKLQGSLHCMSLNIPSFVPLPSGGVSYDRALRYVRSLEAAPTPN